MMYLLYWLVSPIVYLSVWLTIANSQGSVSGLTANDFITYYLTLLIVDQLTSEITIHILAYKIQDGTLSGELLRPVHPILTSALVNNLAFKALQPDRVHPHLDRPVPAFPPGLQQRHPAARSCWLFLAILIGFCLNFLLGAIITCVAFWTTRVYSICASSSTWRYHAVRASLSPCSCCRMACQQIAQLPAVPDVSLLSPSRSSSTA